MIEVTFTPTAEDHVAIFRQFSMRHYWGCLAVFATLIFTLLCIVGSAIFMMIEDGPRTAAGMMIPGALVLIVTLITAGLTLFYIYSIQPRKTRDEFEKHERLRSEKTCRFSEEGVTITTRFDESKLKWSVYQKIVAIKDHYLLILASDKQRFFCVPKRAFSSAEVESEFRTLAKHHIGQANF